ncbi:MAG: hypothetical protein ABL898_19405 [Hyphomicrobiaceae bacterium]
MSASTTAASAPDLAQTEFQDNRMAKFIAIYGTIALLAATAAGIIAGMKRRDYSFWAAWTLLFPPFLIALLLLPKSTGTRPISPRESDDYDH